MGGKMSRNKGQRGEREVISYLQPVVDRVAESYAITPPMLQRNLLQSHAGGHDVFGLHWLALEVKLCETYNLNAWWEQTLEQAQGVAEPVLWYRRSRVPWRVRMYGYLDRDRRERVLVDIVVEDFITYFEYRLIQEMKPSE